MMYKNLDFDIADIADKPMQYKKLWIIWGKGFGEINGLNSATRGSCMKYHLVKGLAVYFSRKHHHYLKYIISAASLYMIEISNFPKLFYATTVVLFL